MKFNLNKPSIKASLLFFMILILQSFSYSSYSQLKDITISVKNVTVREVLSDIEAQSKFYFTYSSSDINTERKVTIDIKNQKVSAILDILLRGTDTKYKIEDKHIALYKGSILNSTKIKQDNNIINGIVLDSKGNPVIGASIILEGTMTGATTDQDGKFSIKAKKGATLIVSFIGYKDNRTIVNSAQVKIILRENAEFLEDVVVIGYGTKKKSVVTGSISSISNKELMQAKTTNPINALSGRVSGVTLMSASGQPGSVPKLYIRGIGTNGNSSPLYIIDGLPMSDMNSINPSDIQSMEILKDATSTAIYGARGANGVVLITTRQGQKGKSSLTYDGYIGTSTAIHVPELLNSKEYVELTSEFYENDGTTMPSSFPTNTDIDTDWLNSVLHSASIQQHNVTATFGSDKGSTMLSLGYLNQHGIIGNHEQSFFKRYTVRVNNKYDINKYISVGANLNINYIDKNGVGNGTNGWNPLIYAYNLNPNGPIMGTTADNTDTFGYYISPVGYGRMWNPFSFMTATTNGYNRTRRFYGNTYLKFTPIKHLVFKSDIGVDLKNGEVRKFTPIYYHGNNVNEKTSVSQNSSSSYFWQWENTLTYERTFGKHNASILLGSTASRNQSEYLKGSRNNYPEGSFENENFWYLDAGDVASMSNNGGASAEHNLYSLFGRLSYNYDERFMAEFVIRRDGSSNFGSENQYGVFPGVSLGWNISKERFWNIHNFDVLKLRASLGQNGNESINPFSYTSIIANDYFYNFGSAGKKTIYTGSAPQSLINPDVKWETSQQLDLGADMQFFGGKLITSLDYYDKTTKDLLMRPTIASFLGNISAYKNVGKMSNSGFEIQTSYRDNVGDFNYSISFNASYLHNEVNSVGVTGGYLQGGSWRSNSNVTRMEPGHAMGYYYLYKTNGIFQSQEDIDNYTNDDGKHVNQPNAVPGDFKWKDVDNDGEITENDRTDCGNPWPKWTLGLTLSGNWHGFDASIFLRSKLGYHILNSMTRTEGYGRMNLLSFYKDRWTPEHHSNSVPRLSMTDANKNFFYPSDFYLYNASFLKIGNISLGYTLPNTLTEKVNISKARIFLSVENVATFTDYPYMDPEVGAMNGDILETGLDYSFYPTARTAKVGVSITF